MKPKHKRSLWTDSKRSRYFLIPKNQKLSRGSFIICTLTGTTKKVTQTAIAPFEIPEKEAKAYLKAEMNQAMQEAKTALSNFTSVSTQTLEETALTPNIISSFLGITPEELQNNPEAAQTAFVNLYTDLKGLLGESTDQNPAQVEARRSRVRFLRETLQAQAININGEIEELPGKLQETLSSAEIEGYLHEIVAKLRDLTDQIDQSPDTVSQKIDETIESLTKDFFIEEEKRLEEKRKQDYKQSAQDAISQSLRTRGFISFAGGGFNSPTKANLEDEQK
ncbi:hypothetical protein [Nostoc sp. FACHB-888]|uniref:hypothetical protein n=1 Tax=Nostoc sp. FACHB-888 TaxID=2692842 RepID=UPI001686F933|nr:hypothetical protein [Nostoc sp. FACHB-888]MBD2248033.1 hypothetical protein [Nostoc sp. FACHB-888]